MIGGGEATDPDNEDTHFACEELTWRPGTFFNRHRHSGVFTQKARLKYGRKFHAACAFGNRYIIATGSVLRNDDAGCRTEVYDVEADSWRVLPDLNQARCFHATCNRGD